MKLRIVVFLFLITLSTLAWGQTNNTNVCDDKKHLINSQALSKAGINLPVVKKYCYSDKSGDYILYLTEKKDRPFPDTVLSTMIKAHLLKINMDQSVTPQWSVRDFADPLDAGVSFRFGLIEIKDVDNDGLVEPILVYDFFDKEAGKVVNDSYSGRIKIIMFYKGKKIAIRAYTGPHDGDRETVGNDNFFTLPPSILKHLVNKMEDMYNKGQFGFNNSYEFMPVEKQNSISNSQEKYLIDAITAEDLEDCSVLLGQKKAEGFQYHIKRVKELADNGDLENGINYAGIMHNRFVCREDEILGDQPWETIIENGTGGIIQHTTRKTVPSLKDHPKAFVALKDAVSAYTQIADKDLGSHMILGQYYADYYDVLGYSQEGYLLVSKIYEAICHQNKVTEINQGRCKTLDRLKLRYKNLVSQKERNELDQQATVWAREFLENNKADRYLRD